MEVKYKKAPEGAYMILRGETECEEYASRMLVENRISGVLPLTIREIDGEKEYCFDISAGRSMSGVLERRPVTMNEIRCLISALSRTVDDMDEYLMNVNHLVIDPGMICLPMQSHRGPGGYERMEPDFSRAMFCCHPAYEKDFLQQVRELICFFLNKMDHMEKNGVETAYELFQISQKEYFRLEEMTAVCHESGLEDEVCSESSQEQSDEYDGTCVSGNEDSAEDGRDMSDCGMEEDDSIKGGNRKWTVYQNIGLLPVAAGVLLSGWNLYQYLFYGVIRQEMIGAGGLFLVAGAVIMLTCFIGRRDIPDESCRDIPDGSCRDIPDGNRRDIPDGNRRDIPDGSCRESERRKAGGREHRFDFCP